MTESTNAPQPPEPSAHTAIVDALLELLEQSRWNDLNPYVGRYLAAHAERANRIDDLLTNHAFYWAADPEILTTTLNRANTRDLPEYAQTFLACSHTLTGRQPTDRAAVLALTAMQLGRTADNPTPHGAPWWPHWAASTDLTPHRVIEGHRAPIRALVVLSDDEGRIASGSDDGTVRIWDIDTGLTVAILEESSAPITSLNTFTAQGEQFLTTATANGNVAVWSLADNTLKYRLPQSAGRTQVTSAIDQEGNSVVITASTDGVIRTWNHNTREPTSEIAAHAGTIRALTTSKAPRPAIISAGADGQVKAWDLTTQAQLWNWEESPTWINSLTNIPGERYEQDRIALGSDDGTTWIANPQTGTAAQLPGSNDSMVHAVTARAAPRGLQIVSGYGDRTAHLFAESDPRTHSRLVGHSGSVRAVAILGGSRNSIVTAGDDKTIRVWDTSNRRTTVEPNQGHTDWVLGIALTAIDGTDVVLSGGVDRQVIAWNLSSGKQVRHLGRHGGWVGRLTTFTRGEDTYCLSAGAEGELVLWQLNAKRAVRRLPRAHKDSILDVAAITTRGGHAIAATAGNDGQVGIWDLGEPQNHIMHVGHRGGVRSVALINTEGECLAISGGTDGTMRTWSFQRRRQIAETSVHGKWIREIAVLPNGKTFITACDDGQLRHWRPESLEPIRSWHAHSGAIMTVAATTVADSTMIVSAGAEGTIKAWSLNGDLITTIPVTGCYGLKVTGSTIVAATHLGLITLEVLNRPSPTDDQLA